MAITRIACTPEKLDILHQLARQTFTEAFAADNDPSDFEDYMAKAFDRDLIKSQLEDPDITYYLLYSDGELAGYYKLNENKSQTDIWDADSLELERIYVLSELQGRKIGSSVMRLVLDEARERQKKYIWLGVWEKNIPAIRFYQRLGFTKFGEHPYYIGTDKQTDWLMRYELP